MLSNRVKILLIGSSGTGKTSVLNTYNGKRNDISPTIGIEVSSKLIYRKNNIDNRQMMRFYDMSGNRQWWFWIPEYLKDTDIVFVFYDITCKKTFEEAKEIVEMISITRAHIILVGNKTDREKDRNVSIFDVNKYIQMTNRLITHIETNYYNVVSFKKMLEKLTFGLPKLKLPNEFKNTDFNTIVYKKDTSWGDFVFNWV